MTRALDLAALGKGKTSPNPAVGAVIVRGKRVVGEGYHRRAGEAHAEIVALRRSGKAARGATMYVTLEPCCHVGRTGPCCAAIINAGIGRVVFAVRDPDKRVSGKGAKALRKAGIKVTEGVLACNAEQLNEYYLNSQRLGRPYVILKLAQSLDGRIAASSGDSRWITGEESRKYVHLLRSDIDAVMIGAETARKDNPRLTARVARGTNPYRILIGGNARIPGSLKLLNQNRDNKTILVKPSRWNKAPSIAGKSPIVWSVRADKSGHARLKDVLDLATQSGFRSIMVEGGASLATSFLKARLVDKMYVFTAPIIIGQGRNSIAELGIRRVGKALSFRKYTVAASGRDWLFLGYPKWDK